MLRWDDSSSDFSADDEEFEESPEVLALSDIVRRLDLAALRELNDVPRVVNLYAQDENDLYVQVVDGIDPAHSALVAKQMAIEGNDAAVDMLLQTCAFKRNIYEGAVEGYLAVRNWKKADALVEQSHNHDCASAAVAVYAANGLTSRVAKVLHLYPHPDLRDDAMTSYAQAGYVTEAEALLQSGGTLKYFAEGLMRGRCFDKINQYIESDGENQRRRNRTAFLNGMKLARVLKNEQLYVEMLAHIDSSATRNYINKESSAFPYQRTFSFNRDDLDRVTNINHCMRAYNLEYREACELTPALLDNGLRAWMLQSRQKDVNSGKLTYDVFLQIIVTRTGLSYNAAERLYSVVCNHAYEGARKSLLTQDTLFARRYGINGGMVREARRKRELDELDTRYNAKTYRVGK